MPGNQDAILTLEVTGPEAEGLGSASRKRFGAEAATIGRSEDNDWVLPRPQVSGHHAIIEYVDGVFYVTDRSRYGVFINSPKNRLTKGQRYPIKSGDSIIIEPFRIYASITQHAGDAQFRSKPEALPREVGEAPSGPFTIEGPFARSGATPGEPVQSDEVDPLKLLGVSDDRPPAGSVPRAKDLEGVSALGDHFRPPMPTPAGPTPRPQPLIPDDYDPASQDRNEASRASAVAVRAGSKKIESPPEEARAWATTPEPGDSRDHADFAAVLAGAGLHDVPVTPQLLNDLGAILRVVISGVMDLLRARQEIKDEFRMRATRFRPEDNNALKFSANVSDALHNLLVKKNPAYLGPVEAFEDAFNDLLNHQMAMLAGMRMAFESMLAEFEPDQLERQFGRRLKKKSLLGAGPEVQYWELYRERAQSLAKDPEATFRDLFGDRFVRAYKEQLDRLNTRSRRGKP